MSMEQRKTYETPAADLVNLFGDIRADKVGDSWTGKVDNGDNIDIDNGDHTGPDGGWNGDIEID